MYLNSTPQMDCLQYVSVINNCIKIKNLNPILDICKKAIGKSSVGYFFDNNVETGHKKGYVYFLLKNNEIVYIGASSNHNRVGQHQRTKDYDCFYYLPCENYNHWHIETLLIRNFKPKYNCCNVAKFHFN